MDPKTALLSFVACVTFCIGVGVTACVMAPGPRPPPAHPEAEDAVASPVIGYVRQHPDPAVSGPFADKLERGEIKIALEKPREHAMASFGERGDVYVLTLDPERIKDKPTQEELEDVLSILSHEHAHYRQFVEDEMINYHPRGGPMTEAQCTLTILVEIDAHGKACRDARAYGWESHVATSACDRTPASLAEYFLRERVTVQPECKPVWEFYATNVPGKKASSKPRAVNPKRRSGAPIYLPPP